MKYEVTFITKSKRAVIHGSIAVTVEADSEDAALYIAREIVELGLDCESVEPVKEDGEVAW